MAIKQLDNVKIDGINQAFGGYIYSVQYDANYGEQPSTLRVTVTNETGIFNISPDSLYTIGTPVQIDIGTKITLYMYPMEYIIEESPKGKFLQIDYVDESIVYLDKQIIKLKSRGVDNEKAYENTIVIGFESIINSALTNSTSQLFDSSALLSYYDPLKVPDVVYSFPQLLEKMRGQNILGGTVTLDKAAQNYYQSYCGRLREVLSAWCNDLALGFYWENRKLNFVDLNNPANLSAVVTLANNARNTNGVATASTRYSIKDSFTRAIDGQFNKDGELLPDSPPSTTNFIMNYLDLSPTGPTPLKAKHLGLTEPAVFENRVKAAYYGEEAFLLYSLAVNGVALGTSNPSDYMGTLFNVRTLNTSIGGSDRVVVNRVLSGSKYQPIIDNYDWYAVGCYFGGDFQNLYNKYKAYATALGKFFYIKMPGQTAADVLTGALTSDFETYTEDTLLSNVKILSEVIAPLSSEIAGYSTMTLGDFIENNPLPIDGQTLVGQTSLPPAVYVIKAVKPIWKPQDNFVDKNDGVQNNPASAGTVGFFGNTILVEGSSADFSGSHTATVGGVEKTLTYSVFYFGTNTKSNINGDGYAELFSAILPPKTNPFTVRVTNSQALKITNFAPKLQFENYIPPKTANVNYYDLTRLNITEQQILGASYFYYGNYQTNILNRGNFDTVFNDLSKITSVDQPGPFFSATYTIPNIDMTIPTLSIGQGFQGFSISISDNGIRTSYILGTEKMRVRNPDVFIRYTYDNAFNRYRLIYLPSIMLNFNHNPAFR